MTSESGFSGKRLRKFREDKKLTRAAVARRAGVDAEEIEQIETGALDPVLGRLLRIAEAIEVPLADLFSLPPAATEVTIHITPTDAAASGAAVHIIPVPIVPGFIPPFGFHCGELPGIIAAPKTPQFAYKSLANKVSAPKALPQSRRTGGSTGSPGVA